MKLYLVPGVCSLSPHIVLREAGLPFTLERVDLKNNKRTSGGEDYWAVNPKGYVPALRLDDGAVLTEGAAILQYLADQVPEKQLAPAFGTLERYRLIEWLHFIATELHKGMSVFYQPLASEELRAVMRGRLAQRFEHLARAVEPGPWLFGQTFTVADAAAFYVLRAYQHVVKVDLATAPALKAYYARLVARPSVAAALAAEELTP